MGNGTVPLTGTLFWYFGVCPREAWLMGHGLEPYPDHELLALGRLLQETAYPEGRKEITLPGMRLDLVAHGPEGTLVVAEVKRSSGYREAHLLQLGYYLVRLKEEGIPAMGELRYPEERRVERVALTPDLEAKVRAAEEALLELLRSPIPPPPKRIPPCPTCAYYEFCFIGEEDDA
ncbi:CRISPR-associated protein Cas4 (plasmid) [Thermus brockianus]|uniref:CRISPR-associated exonuclease Cas4 n=2 Tax=Thermus brockianus TaxID=56956 RepID=A0ABN6NJQ0_THEBO|nr:CRISPR-associated protein Cas4 [Thermus brockianus]